MRRGVTDPVTCVRGGHGHCMLTVCCTCSRGGMACVRGVRPRRVPCVGRVSTRHIMRSVSGVGPHRRMACVRGVSTRCSVRRVRCVCRHGRVTCVRTRGARRFVRRVITVGRHRSVSCMCVVGPFRAMPGVVRRRCRSRMPCVRGCATARRRYVAGVCIGSSPGRARRRGMRVVVA